MMDVLHYDKDDIEAVKLTIEAMKKIPNIWTKEEKTKRIEIFETLIDVLTKDKKNDIQKSKRISKE